MNANTTLSLTALFTIVAVLVSETTSNTASATMVVPVVVAVAQATKVDPLAPALAACLGASLGFMLPVSTPLNAIVYGSDCIPLKKMVKYGLCWPWLVRSSSSSSSPGFRPGSDSWRVSLSEWQPIGSLQSIFGLAFA